MRRRNRWLPAARNALVIAVMANGLAWVAARAQSAAAADPSPLVPGNLKRPIFDTQTPVYGSAAGQPKSATTVVAEVDGRAITLGDVGDAVAELPTTVRALPFAELFPAIQAQLIRQEALVVRAHSQAIDEDPTVRRKVKAASDRVLANAVLEQEVDRTITEAALLARYNKDIAGKPGPDEVHVRVIMTPTEKAASDIIAELRSGADFAALAKKSSKDATARAGGDAGFVARDGLAPEVGAVVFAMQPGQITPFPVRSAGAWFVLKVEERRHQSAPPFGVAREGLRQEMLREGVSDVVTGALKAVTVRAYDFTGKETNFSSANEGARSSK